MGLISRAALAFGIGLFIYTIIELLAISGVSIVLGSSFTLLGLFGIMLYVFDYLTFFLAT